MNDDELIEELMRELQPPPIERKGSTKRLFRCTFYEKSNPTTSIVVEFFAPFPVDERLSYEKMAKDQFVDDVSSGMYFAIRDLEPVELK
tara:strand:- start:343 stop:609 length:267 start_codon:yes stop_codon:yes gene_type:complete